MKIKNLLPNIVQTSFSLLVLICLGEILLFEGYQRYNQIKPNIFTVLVIFGLLLSVFFLFLWILFNYHRQVFSQAWQRILKLISGVLSPLTVYIIYSINHGLVSDHFREGFEALKVIEKVFVVLGAIIGTYVLVVAIALIIQMIIGWVFAGVKREKL
ncbi:MAG: hypothetical protein D8M58_17290 [Calditrichaeota bacterium]|nr:MAG: hypothetical protein DWQ03_12420 [Calditrichota bacterium]MBL1207163.1 hypothetical protein [Calditrichota bacterium]NOG46995.1 hypothetical protein [Calditrichota bacterium]